MCNRAIRKVSGKDLTLVPVTNVPIITGMVLMSMGNHAGRACTIDIGNQTVIAGLKLLKYRNGD